MFKRVAAIFCILLGASVAWAILGATIFSRTYSVDAVSEGRVASTWGAPQRQGPPSAWCTVRTNVKTKTVENGKTVVHIDPQVTTVPLPLTGSRIDVDLDLDHRQKGLLWYSTYTVDFSGSYTFRNTTREPRVAFRFPLPTTQAIYDDLTFDVDGVPMAVQGEEQGLRGSAPVAPGKTATLTVRYRSQGLTSWHYVFGGGDVTQVRDFSLRMKTDFKRIDFPESTLSPSEKRETADGWDLGWSYRNLLSGFQIGMVLPEKLQPGPLAGRISYFAPVSLFFFFFLVFILTTLRGIDLHPMNYFFLAAAFFAFHLLLAYLVDHVSIHLAFAISSAVSVFLVVTYLRLVIGLRFAVREAALAQLLYLVLFSYAFFLEGFTGLAITIGAILTLFGVMQATGRVQWAEKFAARAADPLR